MSGGAAGHDEIARAVEELRAGRPVGLPTETVYGLAADAENPEAVGEIYRIKGRPPGHPLIVHLADGASLDGWCSEVPDEATALAEALWPGPLSLVLLRGPRAIDAVCGAHSTVAVRVPDHPVAQAVLREFGGGLAAPSANRFGKVSPTSAADVGADLGDAVGVILDGGDSVVGVESTIVELSDEPRLLRPGGVPVELIESVLGRSLMGPDGPSRAPGMLASHYAPDVPIRLVTADEAPAIIARFDDDGRAAGVIGPRALEIPGSGTRLGVTDDEPETARRLYRWLRDADAADIDVVVAVLPSDTGLGRAVRDRLAKAAAPRPDPG